MTLGRHQIPAAIALLGTEETTGLEGRSVAPATEGVQRGALAFGQPGFQLLLLLGRGGLELLVAGDLSGHLARVDWP